MKIIRTGLLTMVISALAGFAMAQHIDGPLNPTTQNTDIVRVRWKPQHKRARGPYPAAVDNSKSRFFPPVIEQKGGSCAQASGIGYMFTYEMNRLLDREAAQSGDNRFAYLFTWNFLNEGEDMGGFVNEGLNIAVRYGIMTEEDYGYASAYQFKWASGYERYLRAMHYRGKKMYEFPAQTHDDIEHIKAYLRQKEDGKEGGGVLTFSTQTAQWTIDNDYQGPSETGYHSLLTELGSNGAHALTIVGYDDTVTYTDKEGKTHQGAFIVMNSWGRYMHDQGRFYLPYHFFEQRGTAVNESTLSTSMTGIEACTHLPQLVFKVGINYTSRNDISIVYGASDDISSQYPKERFSPTIFMNQGGDYSMNGAFHENENFEFALDYTENLPADNHLHAKYFLNIIRSERGATSGTGRLTSLSLLDYRHADSPREYRCKNIDGRELKLGDNLYTISTRPAMTVSGSPLKWLDKNKNINTRRTYIIRTADGKYAKLKFVGYDKQTGKVTIQYLHQNDGTRNLGKE